MMIPSHAESLAKEVILKRAILLRSLLEKAFREKGSKMTAIFNRKLIA